MNTIENHETYFIYGISACGIILMTIALIMKNTLHSHNVIDISGERQDGPRFALRADVFALVFIVALAMIGFSVYFINQDYVSKISNLEDEKKTHDSIESFVRDIKSDITGHDGIFNLQFPDNVNPEEIKSINAYVHSIDGIEKEHTPYKWSFFNKSHGRPVVEINRLKDGDVFYFEAIQDNKVWRSKEQRPSQYITIEMNEQ